VFLLEPNETPYDLRFSLFRIPVRVHPLFWLLAAILGYPTLRQGPQYLIAWIVLVFVSILIHELGHVWMGMAFGSQGRIILYSFGGLAVGSNQVRHRWQRILVLFAGPLAGFVLVAIALAAQELRAPGMGRLYLTLIARMFGIPLEIELPARMPHLSVMEQFLMSELCFINIAWGLLNLLPIWPLDGGQISRQALEGVSPRNGAFVALSISAALAALLAVHSLMAEYRHPLIPFLPFGDMFTAFMFGMLAYQSVQMLQALQAERRWHDDHWR
jgi:stage IV sporulation protein FB